jgi:hypothetical protein
MRDLIANPVFNATIRAVMSNPDLLLTRIPSTLWTPELVESCFVKASHAWVRDSGPELLKDAAELNALSHRTLVHAADVCTETFLELATKSTSDEERRNYKAVWKEPPDEPFCAGSEAARLAADLALHSPSTLLSLPAAVLRLVPVNTVSKALAKVPTLLPTVLVAGIELEADAVVQAAKAAPEIYPALSILPRDATSPVAVSPLTITAACWAALSAHPDKALVAEWMGDIDL